MKAKALREIGTCLDTIEALSTRMYYNDESPAVATGLIRTAVQEARKALYTAQIEEMEDELFPLTPEQEIALNTGMGEVF